MKYKIIGSTVSKARREANMDEMLQLRKVPGLNTDTTFLANRGTLQCQLGSEPEYLKEVTMGAMQAGYTPNINDVYLDQLADFTGDPKAFVPATNAKGHVINVCEKTGRACPDLKVKAPKVNNDPLDIGKVLAKDIVQSELRRKVVKDPGLLKRRSQKSVQEEIVDQHGYGGK